MQLFVALIVVLIIVVIAVAYLQPTWAQGTLSSIQSYHQQMHAWLTPEKMTRIYRGVGALNDADETPTAAGVISSMPLMDYTYTYWDGTEAASCDECPNETLCPECPNRGTSPTVVTPTTTPYEPFVVRGGGEMQSTWITESDYIPSVEPFASIVSEIGATPPARTLNGDLVPSCDGNNDAHIDPTPTVAYSTAFLDPDYVSSRERLGAATSTCGRSRVARGGLDSDLQQARADYGRGWVGAQAPASTHSRVAIGRSTPVVKYACGDYCMTPRYNPRCTEVAMRGQMYCPDVAYDNTLKLLYLDTLGLDNPHAAPNDCQYFGINGYLYKEACPGQQDTS